jgi:hypothetical protein
VGCIMCNSIAKLSIFNILTDGVTYENKRALLLV